MSHPCCFLLKGSTLILVSVISLIPRVSFAVDGIYDNIQVNEDLNVDGELSAEFGLFEGIESNDIAILNNGSVKFSTSDPTVEGTLSVSHYDGEGYMDLTLRGGLGLFSWNKLRVSPVDNTLVWTQSMELGRENSLTLLEFNLIPGNEEVGIRLDPNGTSEFKWGVSLNGADNQMPIQEIEGDGSILNVGLADDRYATIGKVGSLLDGNGDSIPDSIAIGNSAYVTPGTWGNQFAIGDHTAALSEDSVAIGNYSVANAWASTVVGSYSRTGGYSTAVFGNGSTASGHLSTTVGLWSIADAWSHYCMAVGISTWATGDVSTTFGWNSVAKGWASMSMGEYTEARGNRLTVMGRLNLSIPESISDEFSNPLFVIGNGEYTDDEGELGHENYGTYMYEDTSYPEGLRMRPYAERSNALVIRKNGSMDVIAHSSLVSGAVLSVKDGSADPAAPSTVMYVDKAGVISSGSGNGASEGSVVGAEASAIGDYAVADTLTSEDRAGFAVGVGTSENRANAMVVRKSGDVDVAGALRVPPAGDLAMGAFTAGRDPRLQLDPNEVLPSKDWGDE